MSCNAWEAGTIKLPTAEAVRVKNALKSRVNMLIDKIYNLSQEFWRALPAKAKTNWGLYSDCIQNFSNAHPEVSEELWFLLSGTWDHATSKARRVQKKDVQKHYGPIAGANPTFWIGDGSISFKGREVTYDVSDSHGCDRPREHPISRMLWSELAKVNWTRGSGGEIRGNNEYNEEAGRYATGGGGSYLVMSFGPKSKKNQTPRRVYS